MKIKQQKAKKKCVIKQKLKIGRCKNCLAEKKYTI